MRADNEHVFGNSVESLEDDAKPHCHPDNNWEDNELKIPGNGNENACDLFVDKLDDENGGDKVNGDHFSAEGDSLEKEGSVFYMDKSVTACDLPEIVVCYKENTYHVVKDICVDEGVAVKEKSSSNENDSCKCISDQCGSEDPVKAQAIVNAFTATAMGTSGSKSSDIIPVEVNEHSEFCNASVSGSESVAMHRDVKDATEKTPDVQEPSTGDCADAGESRKRDQENLIATGEVMDYANCSDVEDMPTLDAPETSPGTGSDKHICTQGKTENLLAKDEVDAEGITTKDSLTLADVMSMEDCKKLFNHNHKSHGPEEQCSQESSGKRSLESGALSLEVDGTENSRTGEENSCCDKNDDSSKASRVDSETGSRSNELQRIEPGSYYYLPEDPGDHRQFPSHFMSGFGETSFSAAEPVSGHITYSGPIAFSGSLSVRSDGSTTSTRSFAFPVLQSEWNSSPVRMAKADKRHIRSRKSWRDALCCCSF
ncbi:PREDICTED: uncharacterized protein LOC104805213 isoform X3 [Tarenaya hassleriana]|uniref:uncharacterized protein LOC104805213 isoform X3 n=1 Tax=Tarenaya hassleriana TaxID=28532 RepID=UPI0008FD2650|nr:PREDICTED: uncharacterized protein LOC104805213 isoform X3 [Tarenaya hassleriana]